MENNTYDLAITFGRFNLLHIGHLDLFERMAKAAHECTIGVSSAAKNLPLQDRLGVIRRGVGYDALCYSLRGESNPFSFFEKIAECNSSSVVLFLGEDQEVLAKAAQRVFGWDYVLVKRLCSSTEVRSLIDTEQWDRLVELVPVSILPTVVKLREEEVKVNGN